MCVHMYKQIHIHWHACTHAHANEHFKNERKQI